MREYECMKIEVESNLNMRCICRIIEDEDGVDVSIIVNNLEEIFIIENYSL